jgi:intraflagellar transport protein 80
VRWSHDGQAIVTGGEDGAVKVWSRSGMLRTTLVSGAKPVFAARWGADNNSILIASGRELSIATIQGDAGGGGAGPRAGGSGKALTWKAHDGVVLCADWAPVTARIVSGGEDCRYRVWDAFGRQLFVSAPFDTVVTSLAWAPSGGYFGVGTHNALRLCDALGWSHCRRVLSVMLRARRRGLTTHRLSFVPRALFCPFRFREKLSSGSVQALSWTPDGTAVAAGCGGGAVIQAQVCAKG